MTIDGTVLIQVYATVLTGVLIFMTVQRLFEGKDDYELESSRLNKQKKYVEVDKQTAKNELKTLETHLERLDDDRFLNKQQIEEIKKQIESKMQIWKAVIEDKSLKIAEVNAKIELLDNSYKRRSDYHRSIKETERFLNVVMVGLMGLSIIVVLVDYERTISVIFFSISIILLIVRVCFHGEEVS
jgi:lipopolysaccharide export LptBFGC system permease protein LptF